MTATETAMDVVFPADSTFVSRNFIVNFQQLRFEKTGLYSVDLWVDGRQLCGIPMAVKLLEQKGN